MENRQHSEAELPNNERQAIPTSSLQVDRMYRRFIELMTTFFPSNKTTSTRADPIAQSPTPGIKNKVESGRRSPFVPLTAENITEKTVKDTSIASGTVQTKSELRPVIRLTATFISTGLRRSKTTVIVEESGVSRFISVGDTVAGMTVAEIQRGKVILNRGGKKCVMTLGLLPKEAFENGP